MSKSPIKETVSSRARSKVGKKTRFTSRSITPVIKKKEAFYSAPKQTKQVQREPSPFAFSSYENIHNGESILKCNESGELESIEQDIANLDQLKNFGKISEQFIFELDETEEQHLQQMRTRVDQNDGKNVFKKQPNQLKGYQKIANALESKPIVSNTEEVQKKRMIMEYLKIVKNKISVMEKKLEEVTREAQYYKTKSAELESSKEKVIEKEKLMAMKYGIILSQNKELLSKLKKKKMENEDYKMQIQHIRKESLSDLLSNEAFNKRLNTTHHNHKNEEYSPMLNRNMPTSYSSTSIFKNLNEGDLEMPRIETQKTTQFQPPINNNLMFEDEVTHSKSNSETLGTNLLSLSQQNALNSFTSEQKSIVKSLINNLLWEQSQKQNVEIEKPTSQNA